MIKDFLKGVSHFINSIPMIFNPGIKRFVIAPVIISILTFGCIIYIISLYYTDLLNWLLPNIDNSAENSWYTDIYYTILSAIRFLMHIVFFLTITLLYTYFFSTINAVFAGPFCGILSEKVEEELTGNKETPIKITLKLIFILILSIIPAIGRTLRKLLYSLKLLIPILILYLIPVLNIIAPILWIIASIWLIAIEAFDIPSENHKLSFTEGRKKLAEKRAIGLGLGAISILFIFIPIINFLVIPISVIAATKIWVYEYTQTSLENKIEQQ